MEYYTCSDDALLLIFKSGDVRGFNILFDRHWASLFRLARKILEDDDLAKDTVQQVFVSFYEKAHAKEINHVKGYLLHSVKYQCFMHLRSGKINENIFSACKPHGAVIMLTSFLMPRSCMISFTKD